MNSWSYTVEVVEEGKLGEPRVVRLHINEADEIQHLMVFVKNGKHSVKQGEVTWMASIYKSEKQIKLLWILIGVFSLVIVIVATVMVAKCKIRRDARIHAREEPEEFSVNGDESADNSYSVQGTIEL